MKYAIAFSTICLAIVLSFQQCSVYKSSGIKGFDKTTNDTNICGEYLSAGDLPHIANSKLIFLEQSREMQKTQAIDVCTISLSEEIISVCKISEIYFDRVYEEIDASNTQIMTDSSHEFTYFTDVISDDFENQTNLYMFMSATELIETKPLKNIGVVCSGDIRYKVEDSHLIETAIIILENLWYNGITSE